MAKDNKDDLANLLSAMADGHHHEEEGALGHRPSGLARATASNTPRLRVTSSRSTAPAPDGPTAAPASDSGSAPPWSSHASPTRSNPFRSATITRTPARRAAPRPVPPSPRPSAPIAEPPAPAARRPIPAPRPAAPAAPSRPPAPAPSISRPATPAPPDLSGETETATAPPDSHDSHAPEPIDVEAAAEALEEGIDESDELAIPAPAADIFIHPPSRPARKPHLFQTIGFKRTIIPISFTIALLCFILLGLGWMGDASSSYSGVRDTGMTLMILAVAVVMAGVCILTMFQVRSDLARQAASRRR